jgi:hypothetical protein
MYLTTNYIIPSLNNLWGQWRSGIYNTIKGFQVLENVQSSYFLVFVVIETILLGQMLLHLSFFF